MSPNTNARGISMARACWRLGRPYGVLSGGAHLIAPYTPDGLVWAAASNLVGVGSAGAAGRTNALRRAGPLPCLAGSLSGWRPQLVKNTRAVAGRTYSAANSRVTKTERKERASGRAGGGRARVLLKKKKKLSRATDPECRQGTDGRKSDPRPLLAR
jgi:hypothetical protein